MKNQGKAAAAAEKKIMILSFLNNVGCLELERTVALAKRETLFANIHRRRHVFNIPRTGQGKSPPARPTDRIGLKERKMKNYFVMTLHFDE